MRYLVTQHCNRGEGVVVGQRQRAPLSDTQCRERKKVGTDAGCLSITFSSAAQHRVGAHTLLASVGEGARHDISRRHSVSTRQSEAARARFLEGFWILLRVFDDQVVQA